MLSHAALPPAATPLELTFPLIFAPAVFFIGRWPVRWLLLYAGDGSGACTDASRHSRAAKRPPACWVQRARRACTRATGPRGVRADGGWQARPALPVFGPLWPRAHPSARRPTAFPLLPQHRWLAPYLLLPPRLLVWTPHWWTHLPLSLACFGAALFFPSHSAWSQLSLSATILVAHWWVAGRRGMAWRGVG